MTEYAIIEVGRDGRSGCLVWLSDWPSLCEARAEVKRLGLTGDRVRIVPARTWHMGDYEAPWQTPT